MALGTVVSTVPCFWGNNMDLALGNNTIGTNEYQIAQLLEFRFGDGLVYLPKNRPKQLYSLAKEKGFIDREGYLTRKGRTLLARFHLI